MGSGQKSSFSLWAAGKRPESRAGVKWARMRPQSPKPCEGGVAAHNRVHI
jgi:hypothetical protein